MHVLQVTWCGQVFNEPGTVLCTLISQTLAHLDPSLSSCITEFIKNEPNIIGKLIELRQVRRVHICHLSFHIPLVIRYIRMQSFSTTESYPIPWPVLHPMRDQSLPASLSLSSDFCTASLSASIWTPSQGNCS